MEKQLEGLLDLVRQAVRQELKDAAVEAVPMFMTKAKAARVFGVGITKFEKLIKLGAIELTELEDGSRMVSKATLERFQQRHDAAAKPKRVRPPKPKAPSKTDGMAQAASFREKLKTMR